MRSHGRDAPVGVLAGALLGPLMLSACMLGPDYKTPKAEVAAQWPTDTSVSSREPDAADAYWWKSLKDPALDAVIEAAFRNNPSLQIAGVRVLAARAQLNQSIGNLFPQQQALSGGATYTKTKFESPLPGSASPEYSSDQLMFSASWEIDFWGKYRRNIESDQATYLGTVASYDDALVTLIADVATSYVNIRTTEERMRVPRATPNPAGKPAGGHRAVQVGETSELDERQATTILGQTEAQIPRLQNSLNQAHDGLAVLLGITPDQLDTFLSGPGEIPSRPSRSRWASRTICCVAGPTCARRAYPRRHSRAHRRLPGQHVSGAVALRGLWLLVEQHRNNSLGDIFTWQSRVAQAGACFVWPVFNYGRLVNQVRVQDANFQQAVLNYQNTVLNAQQEVENGISAYHTEQQALANLTQAAEAARRSTALSLIQYKSGETDYTTVLSTEQAQLSVEDSVASSRGNVLLGMIGLYRALGGGWEIRKGQDVISDEVNAEMARRTNWGQMLKPENHLPGKSPEVEP